MIPINHLSAAAYVIPTATPESDGTLEWNSTTLVIVELEAGGKQGLGYSYADRSIVDLIRDKLAKVVVRGDAYAIAASAIAAVDSALWDLKAKLLVEYFFDHARIEKMLFNGAAIPVEGQLKPDLSRPGLGIEFKHADAAKYAA